MISPIHSLFAVLEFTSLPMLGWLAAAVLPWLIHRWQRRHHQTTPWAAVELLQRAMQHRARRVQLQQWLLLAVRTAILVIVAMAVAEPTLRQGAIGAGGNLQTHLIVVVDQSYSMGCEQQGVSRWQRAKMKARQWLENSDNDALTLIGWAAQAENLIGRPTFDRSVALAALDDLRLSQSSAELSFVLRAIVAAIDRAEVELPGIAVHQVVFCTDLGRQTWSLDDNLQELIEAVSNRAKVTIVNVAESRCNNLAVTDLQIDPEVTLLQQEATITATVTSFGHLLPAKVNVDLLVEDRRVAQQQVELRKEAETTVRFSHRFVGEGTQTVQVVLAGNEDCLSIDNERFMVVEVRPKLRVACFAGHPGAANDLARALAPGGRATDYPGVIEPEVYSASRLGDLDLSSYAAVMLSSVAELSPREARTLTNYVRQGRGLAVFLAQEIKADDDAILRQLLPVRVHGLQEMGEYRFDPLEYRHRIVSPFRGQTQSGLLGVSVSQYCQLQLLEEHPTTEVVLKFNTGNPALVVDHFGLGRIAVFALPGSLHARTSNGTPWSSFALSPSFLPVVRELVAYLVGDCLLQQRNIMIGETAEFPGIAGAKRVSVRLPNGARQTLPLQGTQDHGPSVFRETNLRGVYVFRAGEKELARIAVNLDGRDSDLSSIDLATLPASISATTVEGPLTLSTARVDRAFARTLLAIAFGLLLFEIGLAWMLGRGWG